MEASLLVKSRQQLHEEYASDIQNQALLKKRPSLIEFGWGKGQQFQTSRIKGAIYVDSAELETPPEWILKPDVEIKQVLGRHLAIGGQSMRSGILVYNRDIDKFSILPACRLALLLLHFDLCHHVDVLLGGYEAYIDDQNTELKLIRVKRGKSGTKQQLNKHQIIVSRQGLEKMLGDIQLVDVRTKKEYDAECSGYEYMKRKGRIPGAIYHGGNMSCNSCQVKQYSPEGQFLKMWESQNIVLSKPIVLYCGSGWRASEVMVYAILNDIKQISLYSNGWFEWSRQSMSPMQKQEIQQKTATHVQLNFI